MGLEEYKYDSGENDNSSPAKTFSGLLIILAIAAIFYLMYLQNNGPPLINPADCIDGTKHNSCSNNPPYLCSNGELLKKPSVCGCQEGYETINESCTPIKRCPDKTKYNECSETKPLFCSEGELTPNPSTCSCPENQVQQGDGCISRFTIGEDTRILEYTLRGKNNSILAPVYKGLYDYLGALPRTYYCSPACPSEEEIEIGYLEDEKQKPELLKLAELISGRTKNQDDRARIAISMVQTIPYDTEGMKSNTTNNRYPYEVIYDDKGICGEKSRLLAFILREQGYGVVLLEYEKENHMAVGIKCPQEIAQYEYNNTAYCFIETTTQTITTDNKVTYAGAGKLVTNPVVYYVSSGAAFNATEEYNDNIELASLNAKAENNNQKLAKIDYAAWKYLMAKYNMPTAENTNI